MPFSFNVSRSLSSFVNRRRQAWAGCPRELFLGVTGISVVETFFWSFTLVYAFTQFGFKGALIFFALQCIAVLTGYWATMVLFARKPTWADRMLQGTGVACASGLVFAGLSPNNVASLACLLLSGVAVGGAVAVRQWLELTLTKGASREYYLVMRETANALIRIGGLTFAAYTLALLNNEMPPFFLISGSIGVLLMLWTGPMHGVVPPSESPKPFAALLDRSYWNSAPFFLIESGSSALRGLIGVSGVMTIFASASKYGFIEVASALTSMSVMWWLGGRTINAPSLTRLSWGLTGLAVAWLALGVSLVLPWFFVLFLLGTACAGPVVSATYNSLVMTSMESPGHTLQSNAVAREILLVSARCGALLAALALTSFVTSPTTMLLLVLVMTVLLFPLEYVFAKRIATSALGR